MFAAAGSRALQGCCARQAPPFRRRGAGTRGRAWPGTRSVATGQERPGAV